MAATWIKAVHKAGMSAFTAIDTALGYAMNAYKTNDMETVIGYECSPFTATADFALTRDLYLTTTGKYPKKDEVLAYHLRQAFLPGEISPEQANKVGYDTAMALTKGKHQFIVATHLDKKHIHNHIIICAFDINGKRKFRNFWNSTFAIRRISDQHCLMNGLSVIENPKPAKESKDYDEWLGNGKKPSYQEQLRAAIDAVLSNQPQSFDDFLIEMQKRGYEIKQGKHISFKAKEQKKFTRLRSLGDNYSEENIRTKIGKSEFIALQKTDRNIGMLIDIQNNIKAQSSGAYKNWAHNFNIKQSSQTLLFLEEKGISSYEEVVEICDNYSKQYNELREKIDSVDKVLKNNSKLQSAIYDYIHTKDVFDEFKKRKFSNKFYEQHKSEIDKHRESKNVFNSYKLEKLPTINDLKGKYADAVAIKKKYCSEIKEVNANRKQMMTVKANVEELLDIKPKEKPSLLGKLEEKKQIVAQRDRLNSPKAKKDFER